ncbi:polysaccharide ABC transporter ATP-binding protein [Dysgonomonas sp. BGC7]|uniref:ABC transporter ATP-binding protein n=1 Tax=Dysgonomonas sp. BGC7 TaxID=1658008 RepID=UPI000681EDAA|nr:polysaccharide ABC transporter ATP-binding protein [Dysgonomonas sp. BGC7]MBD8390047.1 ATP-binding cassette domain-containing protein [Dysgonomonas sp. BGC7]
MSDIAIKFDNISKQYRLGLVGTGTISHDINRWWHTVRGKEDPYLRVGEVNDRSTKAIGEYVWALRDISFEVKQGEVLGIIGKNGAGKSTLLKILSRVTTPTTGTIKAKGRIASLLEVGTGFHPELTGRENIYMNGSIMGMTKSEITSKLDEIVDFAGIEKYIDTPAKRYSSGMTVRLGFAIAAHLEPEILVVDEVLAVGDAEFQKKAIGKMQDVAQGEGRTVLFVSHNMGAVKALCTQCLLLKDGSVALTGNTDTVINHYSTISNNNISEHLDEWMLSSCGRLKLRTPYFLNEQGIPSEIFSQGENINVVFEFEMLEPLKKIVVGVALNDMQDSRVLTTHSIDDNNFAPTPDQLRGKVKIMASLKTQYLAPKSYQIFFGVRDEANNNIIKSKNPLLINIDPSRKLDGNDGILVNAGNWQIL